MTRKDYIAIAKVLADRRHLHAGASQRTVDAITDDLCVLFQRRDNPNFKSDIFRKAVKS
jgi:hypothetical protein